MGWRDRWRRMPCNVAQSSLTRLCAMLYTADDKSMSAFVDTWKVGAKPGSAPNVAMNWATRVRAGEQSGDKDAAQGPFAAWVKVMALMTAAAIDLSACEDRSHLVESLNCLGLHCSNRITAAQTQMAVTSLTEGLRAWPQILHLEGGGAPEDHPADVGEGACVFYGMNFNWDVACEVMPRLQAMKKGAKVFFSGIRNASLRPDVPTKYLKDKDSLGRCQNLYVAVEGVRRALPLWGSSQFPDDHELAIPCLTQCHLVCDPVVIPENTFEFVEYGFLFMRLRYEDPSNEIDIGLDSFLDEVRKEVPKDNATLKTKIATRTAAAVVADSTRSLGGYPDLEELVRCIGEAKREKIDAQCLLQAMETESQLRQLLRMDDASTALEAAADADALDIKALEGALKEAGVAGVSAVAVGSAEKRLAELQAQEALSHQMVVHVVRVSAYSYAACSRKVPDECESD